MANMRRTNLLAGEDFRKQPWRAVSLAHIALCLSLLVVAVSPSTATDDFEIVLSRNLTTVPTLTELSRYQICVGTPPPNLSSRRGCSPGPSLVGVGLLRLRDCPTAINFTVETPGGGSHILVGSSEVCGSAACEDLYRVHVRFAFLGTNFRVRTDLSSCTVSQGNFPGVRLYFQEDGECSSSASQCSVFGETCINRLGLGAYQDCAFRSAPGMTTGPTTGSITTASGTKKTNTGLWIGIVVVAMLVVLCGLAGYSVRRRMSARRARNDFPTATVVAYPRVQAGQAVAPPPPPPVRQQGTSIGMVFFVGNKSQEREAAPVQAGDSALPSYDQVA